MYDYKFVEVGLSSASALPKEDYQEMIREHAQEGWRLKEVLIFKPLYPNVMHIIFEKKK